ncbi:MAG: TIGR04282 family arsenosugar biosynthesis glycosyltransferase [Verrucomicrobiota bacterium]
MLKVPRPGYVKTRLAKSIGDQEAAHIFRKLVEHQVSYLKSFDKVEIHYAPRDGETEMKEWLGQDYHYEAQPEGNLGDRLLSAMHSAFKRGAESVVFIGGDCPYIDESLLFQIAHGLKSHDVVLGPSKDGGYYFIGMKGLFDDLFQDIEWSTDQVFMQTMQKIGKACLSCQVFPVAEDVDDLAAWEEARILVEERLFSINTIAK